MQTEDPKSTLRKIRNAAIISSVLTVIFFIIIYGGIEVSESIPFANPDHIHTYAGLGLFISLILWISLWSEYSKQKSVEKCTDKSCTCRENEN